MHYDNVYTMFTRINVSPFKFYIDEKDFILSKILIGALYFMNMLNGTILQMVKLYITML